MSDWKTYIVETKLGKVVVSPTDGKHVYVTSLGDNRLHKKSDEDDPENYLNILGKRMRLCLHLNDYGEGFELTHDRPGHPGWHYLALQIVPMIGTTKDASDAARRTVLNVIPRTITEWVRNNPHVMTEAAIGKLQSELATAEEELRKMEREITHQKAKIAKLKEQLNSQRKPA